MGGAKVSGVGVSGGQEGAEIAEDANLRYLCRLPITFADEGFDLPHLGIKCKTIVALGDY
jgi:hypothetical protein